MRRRASATFRGILTVLAGAGRRDAHEHHLW